MPAHEAADGVAHARAALAGNPSDGYGGAVLALTLSPYRARVHARPAAALSVEPASLLVEAAARRFARQLHPPALATALRWTTSIPRGVGLGGSSAIVIATLRALASLHGVELGRAELAAFALAVETEDLGIAAGPQDRVAQAHEGLTFMDFSGAAVGSYEPLHPRLLPPLIVAWRAEAAADSGTVHTPLRARFDRGEADVVNAMKSLAAAARDARSALLRGVWAEFARAVDASFDARRQMMELDPRHVEMIEIARACGAAANYTGSGGAIVAVCRDEQQRGVVDRALADARCRLALIPIEKHERRHQSVEPFA
jgi:glucuronokinase